MVSNIVQVANADMLSGDFTCKSSISKTSCTFSMDQHSGMRVCLNLGKKCKGFTYNLGPNTVTLKTGVLDRPKFTLGVITVLKKEYKEFLDIREESCAPVLVSYACMSFHYLFLKIAGKISLQIRFLKFPASSYSFYFLMCF